MHGIYYLPSFVFVNIKKMKNCEIKKKYNSVCDEIYRYYLYIKDTKILHLNLIYKVTVLVLIQSSE